MHTIDLAQLAAVTGGFHVPSPSDGTCPAAPTPPACGQGSTSLSCRPNPDAMPADIAKFYQRGGD
jgi:hypothetical protein